MHWNYSLSNSGFIFERGWALRMAASDGITANYLIWDSSKSAAIAFMSFMRYGNQSQVLEMR
jgi:hypothetical protein